MSDRASRLLARLVDRAAADPTYLGWLLERYRASEGLGTSALAALLGIGEDSLPTLSLCLRPRADRFAADVRAVAAHAGADPAALAAVVRHVDAIDAMAAGDAPAAERGFLLAARARELRRVAEPGAGGAYGAPGETGASPGHAEGAEAGPSRADGEET